VSDHAEAPGAKGDIRRAHVRVRYADTDQMGVTYHANYLVWFEVGRTDWLRGSGWTYRAMEEAGVLLPVIEVFCQYHQPARYDDELEIRTRATALTPVRIRFDYEVVRLSDGVAAASGHSVHAALNHSARPCRLPARVLEMLDQPPGQGDSPTVYN
jgi:acyl-CoA thioester hydrolase